jgi:tetratricopeptide (TPR) repeat protein
MPESARIIRFPVERKQEMLSREEALSEAEAYLSFDVQERPTELAQRCLTNIDIVFAICWRLKALRDQCPAKVAEEAENAYKAIISGQKLGVFDDRNYVLGELAHLRGGATRFLGRRDEADLWLCRAEAAFRHTVNPSPCLAQVSYTRLALRYDMGRYQEVLELLPSVAHTFEKLGMKKDLTKARLFKAMILKLQGNTSDALCILESLVNDASVRADQTLYGRILVDLGDSYQLENRYSDAMAAYEKAVPALKESAQPMALGDLRAVVAATFRNLGRLEEAAEAYAEAKADFASLRMMANVAYMSVLRAEVLLALNRNREAEMEVIGALPMIEEQKMVPDGFAAVAILRESVRRRETDPNALRELREQLKANA